MNELLVLLLLILLTWGSIHEGPIVLVSALIFTAYLTAAATSSGLDLIHRTSASCLESTDEDHDQ